jgi:hypothetical protein
MMHSSHGTSYIGLGRYIIIIPPLVLIIPNGRESIDLIILS